MNALHIKNIFKPSSLVTGGVVLLTTFVLFLGINPSRAHAQFVPVWDPANIAINTSQYTSWVAKESFADAVAYAAGQVAQQLLVQQIVNKIKNLDGAPAFIQDLGLHLLNLQDTTAVQFGNEILSLNGCNFYPTYTQDIRNTISLSTRKDYKNKFSAVTNCTITNPQAFYQNFSAGGWAAWDQILLDPEANNPYTKYTATQDELNQRIYEDTNTNTQELNWGDGFRALKYPGSGLVRTPGAVIKEQLNGALKSSFQSITNADEVTEILGAFVTTVINQALNGIL